MARFQRSQWAILAVGTVLAAACGSSSGNSTANTTAATAVATTTTVTASSAVTTTTSASTTSMSTTSTTTSTTTTIPQTKEESTLLATALTNVAGYEYYDYSTQQVGFQIDDVNEVPVARDTFESMSLHMVVQQQHLISVIELYSLRDDSPVTDLASLTQILLRLHNWPLAGSTSKMLFVGDNMAVGQSGDGYLLWAWIDKGVLYSVWDETEAGNEAYTNDFVAAAMSTQQGLAIPEPTIPKPPSTKYLGPEDQDLINRLPVIEDFFYMDPPYEVAVWFYGAFKGSTALERGSIHGVIHGGDLATSGDATLLGMLMLVELKEPLKNNKKAVASLVNMLKQVADDEDTFSVTELKIGSTTVWVVGHRDSSGFSQAYVWEFKGVAYVFDTNGDCTDSCAENLEEYVGALVVGSTLP